MRHLTPYDTGVIAQPHTWISDEDLAWDQKHGASDAIAKNYGKVDFDDDESSTVATVQVTRNADGTYTLYVITGDYVAVEVS